MTPLHFTPGITTSGYAWDATIGSFNVAGSRSTDMAVMEEGMTAKDASTGSTSVYDIQNAIQDVQVLTTALPAEYGHTAGGTINLVKKTGTNQLHGEAGDYGRTRSMAQRAFFDQYRTSQVGPNYAPSGNWEEPDFNLSGPVYIPKIYNGKNKTFFFVAYQKMIEKDDVGTNFSTTPDAAMLGGNFSFPQSPTGANQLYNPLSTTQSANGTWTRNPFPGNIIPQSLFSPVAQNILNMHLWAAPNYPGAYNTTGPAVGSCSSVVCTSGNYEAPLWSKYFWNYQSIRIDHQITPNMKLYGSYNDWSSPNLNRRLSYIQNSAFDAQTNYSPEYNRIWTVGFTWILTPTIVNQFKASYNRFYENVNISQATGQNWAGLEGIPNAGTLEMPSMSGGFGLSGTDTCATASSTGTSANCGPGLNQQGQVSFRDDLSKMSGKHAFKMGYEWIAMHQDYWYTGNLSGFYNFSGATAGLQSNGAVMPNTGNEFASFLTGSVMSAAFAMPTAANLPRTNIQSLYFQDDWRYLPNLTFNLGVRYSNESPVTTKWGQQSDFSPTAIDPLTGLAGAIVNGSSVKTNRDSNNFQPRIGLAWTFRPQWVARGGFAINTVDRRLQAYGFDQYSSIVSESQVVGNPMPIFQIGQSPIHAPYSYASNGVSIFSGVNPSSRSATWVDPNLRNPYVMNWDVTVQHQLGARYMLEVMYQGSAGVGLFELWPANEVKLSTFANAPLSTLQDVFSHYQNYRPFPNWGQLNYASNQGHSTYHSGSVRLEKRFSSGMAFQTYYTYSKAIDECDKNFSACAARDPMEDRAMEKATAGFNRGSIFNGQITYDLPVGKGKRFLNKAGIWDKIFGGYEIAWVQTFQTGNPMTITMVNSPYNYLQTASGSELVNYPNAVTSEHLTMYSDWRDVGPNRFVQQYRNPTMNINWFAYPGAYTMGNLGRNVMSGPGMRWSQASAKKNWSITERVKLQLRWDFNNCLHTFNFNAPTTAVDFSNPANFAKLVTEPGQASHGGLPLMDLALQLTF
jgi:hypothetical protein